MKQPKPDVPCEILHKLGQRALERITKRNIYTEGLFQHAIAMGC